MLNEKFVYEEVKEEKGKDIFCVFGTKGSGKTSLAMGFSGKKYVISMDRKSMRVKEGVYNNNENIIVINGVKYLSHKKGDYLKSAVVTFDYLLFLLDEIKNKGDCDYLILDGMEIVIEICEMKMRCDNQIEYKGGIANLGVWKDRKLNIRAIHDSAVNCAKAGVIYTTYIDKDEIIEEGTVIRKKDAPKWTDVLMYEIDTVFKCEIIITKTGSAQFMVKVWTSKIKDYKTGDVYNVTDKTIGQCKTSGDEIDKMFK